MFQSYLPDEITLCEYESYLLLYDKLQTPEYF